MTVQVATIQRGECALTFTDDVMMNLTVRDIQFRYLILAIMLCGWPIFALSGESQIEKYFDRKDYARIIDIIKSNQINKLTGVEDYRICAQTAFMFGLYEEACNFYQNVLLINKNFLSEQDQVNYAFSLLKLGKSDELLSNLSSLDEKQLYPWLAQLKNIAATKNSYLLKKDTLVSKNDLSVDFLSQYGLDYFNDHIYYSYPRFSDTPEEDPSVNAMINDRRSELAGIKSGMLGSDGKAYFAKVVKKSLKGSGRIASMNVTDKQENSFVTVVGRRGKPERIVVLGKRFPAFPHNSNRFACAMPFFNQADQRLYFCSDMPGGFGGWDIYYSELKEGKWKWPVNMGPKVNTPFDELFPSAYKELLLFSSEAREGLGDFDNYAYSLDSDTLRNLWPFNTSGKDLSFKIIHDNPLRAIGVNGQAAYSFSSEESLALILSQEGKHDEVPSGTSQKPKAVRAEKALDVPQQKKSSVKVEAPKVAASEPPAPVVQAETPPVVVRNFVAKELLDKEEPSVKDSKNRDVALGNLYYDLNNAVLKSAHFAVLESVAQKIEKGGYTNIVIWSYTDRVGAEKYNGYLSYQRALGVMEFLKSKFKDSDNKLYFTVAAGEYLANRNRDVNSSDRRVEVYANEKGLPFSYVYAYKPLEGETSGSIARIFNNNIDALRELNMEAPESRTSSGVIYVGIQCIHVVSAGETAFSISRRYNCSVDQLLKANQKANNTLIVAEKLIIPLPVSNLKNSN